MMMMMTILSESGSEWAVAAERWEAGEKFASKPNLTEPLYIGRNEEFGQKRKCPPEPLFWGTVYANLT